jgi:hypothetical protein
LTVEAAAVELPEGTASPVLADTVEKVVEIIGES